MKSQVALACAVLLLSGCLGSGGRADGLEDENRTTAGESTLGGAPAAGSAFHAPPAIYFNGTIDLWAACEQTGELRGVRFDVPPEASDRSYRIEVRPMLHIPSVCLSWQDASGSPLNAQSAERVPLGAAVLFVSGTVDAQGPFSIRVS